MKPDFKKAKKTALDLLKRFFYEIPPVNPLKICEDLNIKVKLVELKQDYYKVAGFFYFEENTIFINKDEHRNRQTFTIAHELGHKFLHEEWAKSSDYKALLRNQLCDPQDPKEKEANTFAAHLLVPKFMLDRYRQIASISELSTLFVVSETVIRNRLAFEC